jgi:hypothetical protein
MGTIGKNYLTLRDLYSQMEGDGKVTAAIIDLFVSSNAILEDAVAVECNEGTHHKTTVRNGLPQPQFRQFYQGVECQKGDYTPVTDSTSMLDDYSEVDKKLADINGNTNQFRLNEAEAHIQGMNKTVKTNIFYGSKSKNALAFDGIATRYNKISTTEGELGYQVIDGGGTGNDNTSIYFITWGDRHTHLIYPNGSKAGLQREDKGQVTVQDSQGRNYEAYRDYFSWDLGLSVRNYRSSARIANIDVSALSTANAADLTDLMVDAYYRIEDHAVNGKTVIYANNTIRTFLHKQAMKKTNVNLSIEEFAGKPIVKFLGIPIKPVSEILNTEARVV